MAVLYAGLSDKDRTFEWLAATKSAKLKERQKQFEVEAAKYNVYPMDNRAFARSLTPWPSATAGQSEFKYRGRDLRHLPRARRRRFLGARSPSRPTSLVPEGGAEGMLATQGGEPNGYGLYLAQAGMFV